MASSLHRDDIQQLRLSLAEAQEKFQWQEESPRWASLTPEAFAAYLLRALGRHLLYCGDAGDMYPLDEEFAFAFPCAIAHEGWQQEVVAHLQEAGVEAVLVNHPGGGTTSIRLILPPLR